jgi:prepilin-type N-terminal cleavage/methylation domain-containing protein
MLGPLMDRQDHPKEPARGFTLIELMVVVALIAVLVMLSAPSFKRFIDTQRLRSVNAALITDLQFARSEAASRNTLMRIKFDGTNATMTCYTILVGDDSFCDCTGTPGATVCTGAVQTEIRTVQILRSTGITLSLPAYPASAQSIEFDPATGQLLVFASDDYYPPTSPFQIAVSNASLGGFLNSIEATGRPTSCSPSGSVSGVTPCAP